MRRRNTSSCLLVENVVGYYVVGRVGRDVLSLVVVKRNYETGATVKVARVLAVILLVRADVLTGTCTE